MNLSTKYPLKFATDDLQALKTWLIHILANRHESAYYQLVQFTVGRIVVKIHQKDLGGGSQKLTLNAEQALALQIIIATTDWPGMIWIGCCIMCRLVCRRLPTGTLVFLRRFLGMHQWSYGKVVVDENFPGRYGWLCGVAAVISHDRNSLLFAAAFTFLFILLFTLWCWEYIY
jgi:hypothetical protein